MRLFKIGKLYQPTGATRISAFEDYNTIKAWASGFAVIGTFTEIQGPFLVLKTRYVGGDFLQVLYEEKCLWIRAPYVNCEQVSDIE